jgi:glucokinase
MLVNALNLEACLLGGGIAEAGEPLRAAVAATLPDHCWPYLLARTSVRLARHGRRSGLIGAAVAARGVLG